MRHSLLLLLLASSAVAQQEPPPARQPAPSVVLARLQPAALSCQQASEIWAELQGYPPSVQSQGLLAIGKHAASCQKELAKQLLALRKQWQVAIPAAQTQSLGKDGMSTAERLRGAALNISRKDGLTKAEIIEHIDPARAQLEALLLPTREQVFAGDAKLAAQFAAARDGLAEARAWYDLYLGGTYTLQEVPGGLRLAQGMPTAEEPPASDLLEHEFEFLLLAALPMSEGQRRALEENFALREQVDPEEYLGTLRLNRLRYAFGLPVLAIDAKLTLAARDHSADMVRLGFFAHASPVPGKKSPGDRAARFGSSAGAENIAAGQDTGKGAIEAWWHSPGHHQNMLGGHARTGLGRTESHWTQMFGG